MNEPKKPAVTIGSYVPLPRIDDWIAEHGATWENGLQNAVSVQVEIDTEAHLKATLTTSDLTEWLTTFYQLYGRTEAPFAAGCDIDHFMDWIIDLATNFYAADAAEDLDEESMTVAIDTMKLFKENGSSPAGAYTRTIPQQEREYDTWRHQKRQGIRDAREFLALLRKGIDEAHWEKLHKLRLTASGGTGGGESDLTVEFLWCLYTDSGDWHGEAIVIVDHTFYEPYSRREVGDFADVRAQWSTTGGDCLDGSDIVWVPLRWWLRHAHRLTKSGDPEELRSHGDDEESPTHYTLTHADNSGESWVAIVQHKTFRVIPGSANLNYYCQADC